MLKMVPWYDSAFRLTGRWTRLEQDGKDVHIFTQPTMRYTQTSAPGSYFELAFTGETVRLCFDLGYLGQPFPHLYISVDGAPAVEAPVDRYLLAHAQGTGMHVCRVTYKGGMEMLSRWYEPLCGSIRLLGAQVEGTGVLPEDTRPLIEFIGDSITEGVLIDADYDEKPAHTIDQFNRPYQDDNTATYAALTAKALDLRAMFQAYGAVGMTRAGCGSVPRAGLIYPYVLDGVPYTGEKPRIVCINHGANDRGTTAEEYCMRYCEFLDMVRERVPGAVIVALSAFCGAFRDELCACIAEYNRAHDAHVYFVNGADWVPLEPLHPLRDGHKCIAEHFTPILRDILKKEGIMTA